jgi:hypothetical protein
MPDADRSSGADGGSARDPAPTWIAHTRQAQRPAATNSHRLSAIDRRPLAVSQMPILVRSIHLVPSNVSNYLDGTGRQVLNGTPICSENRCDDTAPLL